MTVIPDTLALDPRTKIAAAGYYAQLAQGATLEQAHDEMVAELTALWPADAIKIALVCRLAFTPTVGAA